MASLWLLYFPHFRLFIILVPYGPSLQTKMQKILLYIQKELQDIAWKWIYKQLSFKVAWPTNLSWVTLPRSTRQVVAFARVQDFYLKKKNPSNAASIKNNKKKEEKKNEEIIFCVDRKKKNESYQHRLTAVWTTVRSVTCWKHFKYGRGKCKRENLVYEFKISAGLIFMCAATRHRLQCL